MLAVHKSLFSLIIWFCIFIATILGYSYRSALAPIYYRVASALFPGMPIPISPGVVAITSDNSGHFHVDTLVYGTKVHFLVDTGASNVALTWRDAINIGLRTNQLTFDTPVSTASGESFVAQIPGVTIQIGDVMIKGVEATVSKKNEMDVSLLGMSFLNKLASFSVERDRMVMTANPQFAADSGPSVQPMPEAPN